MEHFLSLWIDAAEIARVPVTDDIIRSQARIVQGQLKNAGVEEDYTNFELSAGWLYNFKSRYNIGRLKRHGQSGQVDDKHLPAMRASLATQLVAFAPRDRYNCDESGLIFNKQPEFSNVHKGKGKQLSGSKDSKTRITTFHLVNQDNSDKRKIMVIHRSQTPQVFRRDKVNTANLPVIYRFNKKAWMLTGLWYEFLRTLNNEMHILQRYIALITDNCPTHPWPDHPPQNYTGPAPPQLTHVTLIYLPPNTTSHLQPLDQGIIKAFKAAYKRRYAENMVQYFNIHAKAPDQINILQAIYMIADAWDSISTNTIINCWAKADICGDGIQTHQQVQQGKDELEIFIALQRARC